jgi:hypothetical protein
MLASHPFPISGAALPARLPVRIPFADAVSPGCRDRAGGLVLSLRGRPLVQFRSVAIAVADLIAGVVSLQAVVRSGARVQRVFVVQKMIGGRSLHASTIASENCPCPTPDVSNSTPSVPSLP